MAITTAANQILSRSDRMSAGSPLPDEYWELLEQFRDPLVRDALSIVGNRQDAEDIVQETFCEALKAPEKLRETESVSAFLFTINRRNAADRARRKRRDSDRTVRKLQHDPPKMATTGGFSGLEAADFVARAIEMLKPKLRAVIVLHYFEHLTCKQIAERLNIPQGTANRLFFEGMKALSSQLENQLDAPASEE